MIRFHFLKIRFTIILQSTLRFSNLSLAFPFYTPKRFMHLPSPHHVPRATPTSFLLILFLKKLRLRPNIYNFMKYKAEHQELLTL
jgi:hypothetical protein